MRAWHNTHLTLSPTLPCSTMYICKLLSYVPVATTMFPAMCAIDSVELAGLDAAPPNTIRWQTLGSPRDCRGEYLNTIGFVGQPGQQCVGLSQGDPTLFVINFILGDDRCALTLYADESCGRQNMVARFSSSTSGHNVCKSVSGYRSLDVQCI